MKALDHGIQPVVIPEGPVQEVVHEGPVDIGALLPVPTWFERELGPYITAGVIVAKDPETGRPTKGPESFHIDAGICMSCGLCAENCNFDAIKMNHDYEIAVYDRAELLYDMEKLTRPDTYHAEIHPSAWAAEQKARAEKAAKKAAKE